MAKLVEGFIFAEEVLPGFMIETRECNGTLADWMQVECIHWTEYGIMFYGTELLSGRRFFTLPVPASSLITGWRS